MLLSKSRITLFILFQTVMSFSSNSMTTSLSSGTLEIIFTASDEHITIENDGTTITVTLVGGTAETFTTADVNRIVVDESTSIFNTTAEFLNSTEIVLSDGLDIDCTILLIDNEIECTGSSSIEVFVASHTVVMADLTSGSGGIIYENVGIGGVSTDGLLVDNNSTISTTGDGNIDIIARGGQTESASGLFVKSGVIQAGGSGDVMITGGGGGFNASHNIGVEVAGSGSKITSSTGSVTVIGNGGFASDFGRQHGISINDGGEISVGGDETLTITGIANDGDGSFNVGVYISGANSKVTSNNGNVTITGTGGNSPNWGGQNGVSLYEGGQISAGGVGTVTVTGFGGAGGRNGNYGVEISENGSIITSSGGEVRVTGTGGAGSQSLNVGVGVRSAGKITAGGSGRLFVHGTGGLTTGDTNNGVSVFGTNSEIASSDGLLTVEGFGGGIGIATRSSGVSISSGGKVTSTSSEGLVLDGTGGKSDGDFNKGIDFSLNGIISSTQGTVSINGYGGGNGSGSDYCHGITFFQGSILCGSGTALIAGLSTNATGTNNHGINFANEGVISKSSGTMFLTGQGADGISDCNGINLKNGKIEGIGATINVIGAGVSSGSDSHAIHVQPSAGIRNTGSVTNITGNLSGTNPNSRGVLLNPGSISCTGEVNIQSTTTLDPVRTGVDIKSSKTTLSSDATLLIEFGADDDFGSDFHSKLQVDGAIDLGSSTLSFNGSSAGIVTSTGDIILVENNGTDAIIGQFDDIAEGDAFNDLLGSGKNYKLTYEGGDGNDVAFSQGSLLNTTSDETFFSLQAAIDAANDGETIRLTKDVTESSSISVANSVILEADGFKLELDGGLAVPTGESLEWKEDELHIATGAIVMISGTLVNQSEIMANGTNFTVNGTLTNNSQLDATNSTFTVVGSLDNNDEITATGATFLNNGTLTNNSEIIAPGTTLTNEGIYQGSGTLGCNLVNNGTIKI